MTKKKSKGKQQAEIEDMEDINMNEVTDSEEEYTDAQKALLEKVRTKRTPENYDSDDEVYAFEDEKEEQEDNEAEDSMESDIEGLEDDLDLPDERAWGKKKRAYYHTDYVDQDYASSNQKDLAAAEIEEQEAKSIQKRLAEQLDEADFGLEFVQTTEDDKTQEDTEQIVQTDLTKLSKRQKQAIVQKESPEFVSLVNDFKDRMTEARDVLAPFLKMVDKKLVPQCAATSFVKTKYHLSLNYCVNISFYLMLKAKRSPVNSHPVIKRLAQYRQLLNQLEAGQGTLIDDVRSILNAKKEGKSLYNLADGSIIATEKVKERLKKKKQKDAVIEEPIASVKSDEELPEEMEELEDEQSNESENEADPEEQFDEDPIAESDGKRAITYQIAKNRGLTPYRKKELRNPRVKHRNKYRKAKIRRKGAVREVRKEIKRYAGEISGIKAGVKKGIKLK